jgi:hypothetical protein
VPITWEQIEALKKRLDAPDAARRLMTGRLPKIVVGW